GHGQPKQVFEQIHATLHATTSVAYTTTGEPMRITRTSNDGSSYTRHLRWDTLGRLKQQIEPNSGGKRRYAWDRAGRLVGTSDARGCGVNFYYDRLDRVIGEVDYPCLAEHEPHTEPNLSPAEGLEVAYHYDAYEPDPLESDATFLDDPGLAAGRLVSVRDRGSHTRLSYDSRGHVRRKSRRIAKPLEHA